MMNRQFHPLVRLSTRRALVKKGIRWHQLREMMDACSDDLIDAVAESQGVTMATFGAPGDHPIIEAIIAFLQSPQGQALIEAIAKLLMTFVDVVL